MTDLAKRLSTPFQDAKPKESFGFAGEKDIDEDIDRIWQRDKKQ